MSKYDYVKLRPVEAKQTVDESGQPVLFLRDLLQLKPDYPYLLLPQYTGAILAACDGQHTVTQMCHEFKAYTGLQATDAEVEGFLSQLDDLYLLDNENAAQAEQAALQAYRAAPNRPPASAGLSYAADPTVLRQELQAYLDQAAHITEMETGLGLISPHIDYDRGGVVYAQVWQRVAKLAREADCAIILGTDHKSLFPGQITLTRQPYATPFGELPSHQPLLKAIAETLGEEAVFHSELHHRDEWSVELAAVWLHFIRQGEPIPMLPILTGSFQHFVQNGASPAEDETLNQLVAAIKTTTQGQKALVVAAGDLAHIGPAFGGTPIDSTGQAQLQADDNTLLAPVYAGDAEGFFEVIRAEKDSRNVCGTSCIYLAMKIMGGVEGKLISYDRCLADEEATSFVSVCGVTFG
jgi:AmmeMemoRadiSam system protein B